jgi:hypothetical protein
MPDSSAVATLAASCLLLLLLLLAVGSCTLDPEVESQTGNRDPEALARRIDLENRVRPVLAARKPLDEQIDEALPTVLRPGWKGSALLDSAITEPLESLESVPSPSLSTTSSSGSGSGSGSSSSSGHSNTRPVQEKPALSVYFWFCAFLGTVAELWAKFAWEIGRYHRWLILVILIRRPIKQRQLAKDKEVQQQQQRQRQRQRVNANARSANRSSSSSSSSSSNRDRTDGSSWRIFKSVHAETASGKKSSRSGKGKHNKKSKSRHSGPAWRKRKTSTKKKSPHQKNRHRKAQDHSTTQHQVAPAVNNPAHASPGLLSDATPHRLLVQSGSLLLDLLTVMGMLALIFLYEEQVHANIHMTLHLTLLLSLLLLIYLI